MSALAFLAGRQVAKVVDEAGDVARPIEDSLVASHNISQDNLGRRLATTNTLLNPSIGVHKAGMTKTAEHFGTGGSPASEVTLFMQPTTLDRGKLFESDSFSSVFPRPGPSKAQLEANSWESVLEGQKGYGTMPDIPKPKTLEEDLKKIEPYQSTLIFPDGRVRPYNDDSVLEWMKTQGDVLSEGSTTGRFLPDEDLGHVFAHMADARGPVEGLKEAQAMRGQLTGAALTSEDKAAIKPLMRSISQTFNKDVLDLPTMHALRGVKVTPGQLRGTYLAQLGEAKRAGLEGPLARKQAREATLAELRVLKQLPEDADLSALDAALRKSGLKNAKEWDELSDYAAKAPREYMELKTGDRVTIGRGQDADAAVVWDHGQSGVDDTIKSLEALGVEVKRVKVPDLDDPGEFIRKSMLEEVGPWLRAKGKLFVFGGVGVGSGMLVDGTTNTLHAADLAPGGAFEGQEATDVAPASQNVASERVGPVALTPDGLPVEPAASADKAPPASATMGPLQQALRRSSPADFLFQAGSLERWDRSRRRQVPLASFTRPAVEAIPQGGNMTPTGLKRLALDEGERLKVYKDTKGIDTIGVGFNLEEPSNRAIFEAVTGMTVEQVRRGAPITRAHSQELLQLTVQGARRDAEQWIPDLASYPENVQDAITNFMFNVGLTTAQDFKATRAAILRRDGETAAKQLLASRYAQQVGKRASRVAAELRTLKP